MSYFEVFKRPLTLVLAVAKYESNRIRNHLNMVSGGVFIRIEKILLAKLLRAATGADAHF